MTDYVKQIIYEFMCGQCHTSDDCEVNTLQEAIGRMREQGWIIGKDSNVCPRCQREAQ